MRKFSSFLSERFINLIGDDPRKQEHAKHVKALLDKSYEHIGGIHGSGFKDEEDMVKNIPMWKLHKKDGKVTSAVMYKDKSGRKIVAVASDGSAHGKAGVQAMLRDDLEKGRAYGEQSSSLLKFMKRHIGSAHLQKHIVPYDEVHKHLDSDDEIRKPPADDEEVLQHPEYANHFYQRKIGGDWHTKLMMGQPGKKIT